MPPLMGSVAPSTGMDANAQPSSSPDQARGELEAIMGQIRDFGQQIDQLAAKAPVMAPEVQQIRQILKRMIVKAAQAAPQQTASAQGLPE